jgi:L-lactate dehydrogenase complex protein LldF
VPLSHAQRAREFARDLERVRWHDEALWYVREKRDRAVREVPEWEELRERAAAIKAHVLSHLDRYLAEFEARAAGNGIRVHWARDAEEHNRIVHGILAARRALRVVKSKSMLTEECGLNPYLAARGIEVVDTDLGERIVQLRREPPSHIVFPAIHLRRAQIGELFHRELGAQPGAREPEYLVRLARRNLRERFLRADAGITGVNFAIAETGGLVVCTNEGNADLGMTLPPLHVACMGLEKLLPRFEDLGVFTRLLARSGTGQAVTAYTSHVHAPRPGGELHVVIVDAGRSRQLGREEFRRSLACIRCGACLNTCPVYRRSGGYSYGAVVPGPIGSVLAPGSDPVAHASLPFASTLCGSCSDVCPVKIDLHGQLLAWRSRLRRAGTGPGPGSLSLRAARIVLTRPRLYRLAGRWLRALARLPHPLLYGTWNAWGRGRELPIPPERSFREELRLRERRRPRKGRT